VKEGNERYSGGVGRGAPGRAETRRHGLFGGFILREIADQGKAPNAALAAPPRGLHPPEPALESTRRRVAMEAYCCTMRL